MKRLIIFLTASLLTLPAFSQKFTCRQDTVHFYMTNYRGTLVWQSSENGVDWSMVPGVQKDTLKVVATGPAYYRTEVTEGWCRPVYSDFMQLIVNDPPQVTLSLTSAICLNAGAIILNGGYPSGGTYTGEGVIDGKFSPAFAGTGSHKITYQYTDPGTGCKAAAAAFIVVTPSPGTAHAGPDLTMITADSIRLEANAPEFGTGTWTLVNGTFGHFSDIHSPNAWFFRDSSNLDFTLRWSFTSDCGNSTDDVALTFFPVSKHPCPNAPTVTDADGNIYPTVQIGDQCWMAKNLNVGQFTRSYATGADHADVSNNGIIEKYCFNNNPDSCRLYGGLYDWDEAMGYSKTEGSQGICPEGWHLPTYADWNILDNSFKFQTAGIQISVDGQSGFNAPFAGDRHFQGGFNSFGSSGFFWVSGTFYYEGVDDGYVREIAICNGQIQKNHFNKKTGLSVRCIKN
jgi:uncharacterized protein (TIGR02145 family)